MFYLNINLNKQIPVPKVVGIISSFVENQDHIWDVLTKTYPYHHNAYPRNHLDKRQSLESEGCFAIVALVVVDSFGRIRQPIVNSRLYRNDAQQYSCWRSLAFRDLWHWHVEWCSHQSRSCFHGWRPWPAMEVGLILKYKYIYNINIHKTMHEE